MTIWELQHAVSEATGEFLWAGTIRQILDRHHPWVSNGRQRRPVWGYTEMDFWVVTYFIRAKAFFREGLGGNSDIRDLGMDLVKTNGAGWIVFKEGEAAWLPNDKAAAGYATASTAFMAVPVG